MRARRQLPGTRRSTRSKPNIVDKQLVTGMHSLENEPGRHRRLDGAQGTREREREAQRNCLVLRRRLDVPLSSR